MKEAKTYQELPNNYWSVIVEYLPGYTNSDEVLKSDILCRYVEDEEVCEEDLEWLPDSKEEARRQLEELDLGLYNESVRARDELLRTKWKVRKACEAIRDCKIFKVRYDHPMDLVGCLILRNFYSALELVCDRYYEGISELKIMTDKGTVDIVECLTKS